MNNSINCSVESCKHHCDSHTCNLSNVHVGKTSVTEPSAVKDTQCGSFEC